MKKKNEKGETVALTVTHCIVVSGYFCLCY